jgi:hypothetical protein
MLNSKATDFVICLHGSRTVAKAEKISGGGARPTSFEIRLRLRGIAAGIICFAALGKDATGRLKSSRFRSSLPMLASQVCGL